MLFIAACSRNEVSREAINVLDKLSKNVAVGDDVNDALAFLKREGWSYDYDELRKAYGAGIIIEERNGKILHLVIVKIFITSDEKVGRFEVKDAWAP